MRSTKVAFGKKNRLYAKLDAKIEVLEGKAVIDLPIRTRSEANCFDSWRVKHGRHKRQKQAVCAVLRPIRGRIKLPCSVALTRFAPGALDVFDNLPMSFKYIADAVCEAITGEERAGRADGDGRISISCSQVKSRFYGIRIEISW